MLFSATLDNGIDVLVKRYLSAPVTHSVDSEQSPVGTMDHHVLHVTNDDRMGVLVELTSAPGRTIVFTRTKHRAKQLARQLNSSGVPAVEMHGNLSQGARCGTWPPSPRVARRRRALRPLPAHDHPVILDFTKSIEIVVMVILGGMGNTTGVVLAAILLTLLPEVLRSFEQYRMILYALPAADRADDRPPAGSVQLQVPAARRKA